MGTIPFEIWEQSLLSRKLYAPTLTPARCATQRSLLALLPAVTVPSPSAAAASPTSSRPVPPSASLASPRNSAEREALAERHYPGAFCNMAQGSGDGCRLRHLNLVALTCSRDDVTRSKRAVVTVLSRFSDHDLDYSFSVAVSATQFSQFSQFSQFVFRSVLPSFANRASQGFANTFFRSFCSFRGNIHKVSQIRVRKVFVSFARIRK